MASTVADARILAAARAAFKRVGPRIVHRDLVAVADFSQPSRQPRLHLVDMASGKAAALLVAHGRGSDPDGTGWLRSFSNRPNSEATSQGAYLTGEFYNGEHGRSMRLHGLEATNSNAEAREIVIHSAAYVGPDVVREQARLGRSEGCFAVSPADLNEVLRRLGPGRLLVACRL